MRRSPRKIMIFARINFSRRRGGEDEEPQQKKTPKKKMRNSAILEPHPFSPLSNAATENLHR